MRNVTAGSAPGGTSSPFTATASTEKTPARAMSRRHPHPHPRRAPLVDVAQSRTLGEFEDAYAAVHRRHNVHRRRGAIGGVRASSRACRLGETRRVGADGGESPSTRRRASPRGWPKGALSSWLGHSGSCVGKGHGHGHGTQSVRTPLSRRRGGEPFAFESRPASAHVVAKLSLPAQHDRAHATCWSTAACDVNPSFDSLYLQCAASRPPPRRASRGCEIAPRTRARRRRARRRAGIGIRCAWRLWTSFVLPSTGSNPGVDSARA